MPACSLRSCPGWCVTASRGAPVQSPVGVLGRSLRFCICSSALPLVPADPPVFDPVEPVDWPFFWSCIPKLTRALKRSLMI